MRTTRAAFTLILALPAALPAAATAETLELERLNRTYTDVVGELAPLVYDPLVVRLASSSQTVIVRGHRIDLTPVGGGRFRASVEVELSGKGNLIADLQLAGGTPQRMTDEVVLPLQKLVIDAVVSLARGQGGYVVVAHELPKALRVDIRSRLVGDILQSCSGLALLTLGALDCAPVTDALERPSLPLPGPGAELWLADAELTDADRAQIDALIAP
jgi:hypothetical protein